MEVSKNIDEILDKAHRAKGHKPPPFKRVWSIPLKRPKGKREPVKRAVICWYGRTHGIILSSRRVQACWEEYRRIEKEIQNLPDDLREAECTTGTAGRATQPQDRFNCAGATTRSSSPPVERRTGGQPTTRIPAAADVNTVQNGHSATMPAGKPRRVPGGSLHIPGRSSVSCRRT
jgi:hypothetical protein